jgi:hypothetical protein
MTLIFVYKSCSIATAKHSEPILPENYAHIVVLAPDLWIVSVHGTIEFLCHSLTIELLSLLILTKMLFPSLRALLLYWKSPNQYFESKRLMIFG